MVPLLGLGVKDLTKARWRELEAKLATHGAWQARKAGASVEGLGLLRARGILAGGTRAALEALLAEDGTHTAEALAVDEVVRMVHYHRDLFRLLRNFVAFVDFYDPDAHGDLPGRDAVPRRPQLRAVHPRGRPGGARGARGASRACTSRTAPAGAPAARP